MRYLSGDFFLKYKLRVLKEIGLVGGGAGQLLSFPTFKNPIEKYALMPFVNLNSTLIDTEVICWELLLHLLLHNVILTLTYVDIILKTRPKSLFKITHPLNFKLNNSE